MYGTLSGAKPRPYKPLTSTGLKTGHYNRARHAVPLQGTAARVSRLVRYSDPRLHELFLAWPDR